MIRNLVNTTTNTSDMEQVPFAGHSYVNRLKNAMAKTNRKHSEFNPKPTRVHFFVRGGATVPKLVYNGQF